MPLAVGDPAPAFRLKDDSGVVRTLAGFRGRFVVLFFYPEDDTPACTRQACGYRDEHEAFEQAGAVVLGVSPDPVGSHAAFREKFGFPFRLLSDPGSRVAAAYGAFGEKVLYGRKVVGVIRSSVLVGPDGRVLEVMRNVRTAGNSSRMLAAVVRAAGARAVQTPARRG